MVTQVRNAAANGGFGDALPRAVAINYAKLLAYKDRVRSGAALHRGKIEKHIRDQFDGDFKISSTSRRRCSAAAPTPWDGRASAHSAPGCCRCFVYWLPCAACAAPHSNIFGHSATAGSNAT